MSNEQRLNMRRVPMPLIQCYNEDGEIITSPAFLALAEIGRNMRTPMRDLLLREVTPEYVHNWKPITDMATQGEMPDESKE
jgi:hypothetical protein